VTRLRHVVLALVAMCISVTSSSPAAPVSTETARRACETLLWAVVRTQGDWNGASSPVVKNGMSIVRGDTLLGYIFPVDPSGYVVVTGQRELPPIVAFDTSSLDADPKAIQPIVDLLARRVHLLWSSSRHERRAASDTWAEWFSLQNAVVPDMPPGGGGSPLIVRDPLTTTRWTQGYPFLALCPWGDGGRCFVGCGGLALAQLLRYWQWPPHGNGPYSYWWDGDQSCDGTTPGTTISTDLQTEYQWDLMPDEVTWQSPPEQIQAVARLCFDAAAAINTDFGACGSAAQFSRLQQALVDRFYFASSAQLVWRFRYQTDDWFDLIEEEIEQGRPILYSTVIHIFIIDGCQRLSGLYLVHTNFGWGGDHDTWLNLDAVYTSVNPLAEQMIVGIVPDEEAFGAEGKLVERAAGEAGATSDLLLPYPNPGNPLVSLRYRLARDGNVRLTVYDLAGREVRTLVDGPRTAGEHQVVWDGTDAAGRPAASGVYHLLLRAPDGVRRRAVSLAR